MKRFTISYVQKLSLKIALLGITNSKFFPPGTFGTVGTNTGTFKGSLIAKLSLASSF
jgi:hypothetical protein